MNNERDIDKIIADKLRKSIDSMPAQEYEQGAWEHFKVVNAAHIKKQRRIRIYRYSTIGVAAMLFIGLFLLNLGNENVGKSKSFLSEFIALVKNPVSVIEIPALDLDNPITNISSRAFMAQQREAVLTTESQTGTTQEIITLPIEEASALKEAIANTEKIAQTTEETSAIKEKEITTQTTRKIATIKEVEASKENNTVFESDSRGVDAKLLRFGVNISPGFNSTSFNSGSTFNYSGGVTMDIAIAKNLQISTGLQIEHQKVDGKVRGAVAELVPGHIDAVLTNLDIPLNLTWHFFTDKSRSYYVSGGFSSLAYLDEKYTTTSYNDQLRANTVVSSADEQITTYRIENVETVRTTTVSPSNSFEVAGRINLILGYEQKLSSKLNLHIEPFIKIPLTGLASENMRFTTGGVTFKISF